MTPGSGPRLAVDPGVLTEVMDGLSQRQKSVSSKYFYDERGSELFEKITHLPEYYLTRTEREILSEAAPRLVAGFAPRSLVELGAGSARKTRILLDAMTDGGRSAEYEPVDVSASFLHDTADRLRSEYPSLVVRPTIADLTRPLELAHDPRRPALFALLGSTIGNFDAPDAARILGYARRLMSRSDRFLLGVDLRPGTGKSRKELEAAYNDALGVTAEFNRNILNVLNARLGTDFVPDAFRHVAFYDDEAGRIEMHLESERDQTISFPDGSTVSFEEGETLRTEISCKYDRPTVDALFTEAGLGISDWIQDAHGRYALVLGAPA